MEKEPKKEIFETKRRIILSAEKWQDTKIKITVVGGDVEIESSEAPQDLLDNYRDYYYIEDLESTENPAIKNAKNIRFEKK